MKKCYLDSNVLVYLKDNNSPQQKSAFKLISSFLPEDYELFLSSLTIDEYLHSSLFILKHHKIPVPERFKKVFEALKTILDLQHLKIVNPPDSKENNLKIVDIMQNFNLNPRDAYHFLTMQENDIHEFATFDNDFKEVFTKKYLKHSE